FFSGDYLSACDLSTALARLIPAVVRGEVKPKLARTVAYMLQTLTQTIRLSQHEYINAFSTDGWRKAVRTSVNGNHDYLFPPGPDEAEPENNPESHQPAQSPARPATPTSVAAGQARPERPSHPPANTRPSPADTEAALSAARAIFPPRPNSAPPQPAQPTVHPPTPTPTPQPAAPATHPNTQTAPPNNPAPAAPSTPQPRPTRPNHDPYAVHFDHNYRLRIDGKPF
ncbi:MAG: hypothetical protein ACYDCG_18640, partial [Candidatus Acidiferrales bacterium]